MLLKGFQLPSPGEGGRPRGEGWQQRGGAVAAVTARAAAARPQREEQDARPATAMWGFQRGSRLLATVLRTPRVPRAQVTSKPPEHPVSPAVSSLGGRVAEKVGRGETLLPGDPLVRGAQPLPLHYSQIIFVGNESKRGGGRKRRKGAPQSSAGSSLHPHGGVCALPSLLALASILFNPVSPLFNLWGLGYLLRVPCSPGRPSHGASLRTLGRRWQWHWQSLNAAQGQTWALSPPLS